ncbi:hypothetical protein P9112_009793 [Eukaryota sp. TZLM1-RC]
MLALSLVLGTFLGFITIAILYQHYSRQSKIFVNFNLSLHVISLVAFVFCFYLIYALLIITLSMLFTIPPRLFFTYHPPLFEFSSQLSWIAIGSLVGALFLMTIPYLIFLRNLDLVFDFFFSLAFIHILVVSLLDKLPSAFSFYGILLFGVFLSWNVTELAVYRFSRMSIKSFLGGARDSLEEEKNGEERELEVVIEKDELST